jgi:hypothetical protein
MMHAVSGNVPGRVLLAMCTNAESASRQQARIVDLWEGLSTDLIERFLDVRCVEERLSWRLRRGYLEDLLAFDAWMHRTYSRTLITARTEELQAYLRMRVAQGRRSALMQRLRKSASHFYRYLELSGCRSDNPAAALDLGGSWIDSRYFARAWAKIRSAVAI